MKERKPGWYFIAWPGEEGYEVAEWDAEIRKWRQGDDILSDGRAKAVQRIPTPDEPWTTVPVQPDEAMIDAVFWAWGGTDVRSVYIDMISSAPKPEDE